jgi:hypothetical protein
MEDKVMQVIGFGPMKQANWCVLKHHVVSLTIKVDMGNPFKMKWWCTTPTINITKITGFLPFHC